MIPNVGEKNILILVEGKNNTGLKKTYQYCILVLDQYCCTKL
jgi:hypothetical protein